VGNAEKARQIAEQLAALAMVQMGHAKTQDVVQQWSGLISAALADAKREALTEVVALAEAELQNARDNPLQPYDYYLSTLVNALRQLKLRAQENPRG
jgi:oligoendopeptidase F